MAAKLPLVPDVATTARDVLLAAILLPLLVQWWSTYYPDAEPGGGGYVAGGGKFDRVPLPTSLAISWWRTAPFLE